MSIGFVDPAFFTTLHAGTSASLPEWVKEPLRKEDMVPESVVQAAFRLRNVTGFAPKNLTTNGQAVAYFSQPNIKWCQERILANVFAVTQRQIGKPDYNNLVELMMIVWEESLTLSFTQSLAARPFSVTLSYLNRYVVQRACNDIFLGIRAQSAYVHNVSEAPTYDDPNLTTTYVGGTKASQGTLSNSSVLPDAGTVQAFDVVPSFERKVPLLGMNEPLY